MNTSSKSTLSRVIAMIVTFVVLVTTLATTVSAATVSYSWNTSSLPYFNGYGTVKAQYVTKFEISDQKYYGFCIEPNKNMNGSTYISSYSEEDWDAYSNANKSFIALCCYYGYPNASTGNAYYYATQMLIWEIVGGYRTCDTSDSSSFADCDVNFVKKTSYWSRVGLSEATVLTAYNNIVTKVSRHYQTPESILDDNNESILYSTKSKAQDNAYQMTYNFTNKRYEVTFKVPKAYVNSSNSYAYSDLYDDIGDNEYLSISKTSTTSYIKYTVYTKAEFSGTATISTTQQVASVSTDKNIILSWNHAGTQTLISGAASPSAQTAYISFQTPDNPNLKVFKKFTLNGKNVGTDEDTIKDYCDDCKFLVKTSINGEKNYVKFTDNGDGTWTFKGFTTEKSSATYVTPIVTQKSDGYYYGYFALMDLPANVSSTRKYYIVETSGPDAFTLAPTKLATLSSLSDGTTNSYTITNSGTSNYGSVSITKEIADANGNTIRAAADNVDEIAEIYGDTKFVVAMRLSGEYGTITLADGTTASAGDWVYLAGSVCKNPANWSSHALKDEGVEAYSAGDGAYYMNTILDGSFTNGMCANPDYLTTDISEASVFTVGHTYTVNSDGSIDYGDHFGEIFIDGAMLNSKGAVPEMIFIEVEHADGYGLTNVDMSTSYELDEFNDIADTAAERRQFVGSVVTGYDSNYENLAQPAVATVIVNNEGVSEGVEPLLNYSMPMELRIKKTDADTEEPIEGAIYGLYSTKSTSSKYLLESATTNSNGVATFSYKLTYNNTYYVREISSPSGYTLDTTWYEVTDSTLTSEHISKSIFLNIDEFSSALTKITYVTDEPYKLQIQIDKEDDENDIAIEGAVFAIITNQDLTSEETAKIVIGGSGLTSGSSNLDKSAANKAYSEGDVIAYLTTDSKGYAEINGLPLGEYDDDKDEFAYSYTIQETEVPEPYVIDEETYEVSGISESDISIAQTSRWNMALCSFTYNAVNYPETVKVTVTKTGYDDEPVEGVVFDVYAAEDIILSNTTLYSAGDYIGSLSATDSDGRGYSEYEIEADTLAGTATVTLPIYVGFNYYILEDESTVPDGYVASTEKYEFTAAYGGVTVDSVEISMTIPNDYTKVHFTKYEITGEHELEGAILQVIDSDGNVIEEWTSTTEDPEIIATLVAGETYTLHEEVAPNGYVIANDIEFTVSTDGSVDVVEMYDDTTKVQITKYDIT
ncbi:MAG: Cys-Gln thioester bond-forming surface protein, partial [Ruminococcus sp.]|nr:Cys-Gln thioester bond-forming surface protein [Ruminococcus sp.]